MPADGGGTGEEADVKPKIKTKTNDDDMVLYQYSEEELSKMKKDRLVSDDLLYDGQCLYFTVAYSMLMSSRR